MTTSNKYGIVPVGRIREDDDKNLVMWARGLYLAHTIDKIILSGKRKDAEGLKALIMKFSGVKSEDLIIEPDARNMNDDFFYFREFHPPANVSNIVYIAPEDKKDEYDKIAVKMLRAYQHHEFSPVKLAKK